MYDFQGVAIVGSRTRSTTRPIIVHLLHVVSLPPVTAPTAALVGMRTAVCEIVVRAIIVADISKKSISVRFWIAPQIPSATAAPTRTDIIQRLFHLADGLFFSRPVVFLCFFEYQFIESSERRFSTGNIRRLDPMRGDAILRSAKGVLVYLYRINNNATSVGYPRKKFIGPTQIVQLDPSLL